MRQRKNYQLGPLATELRTPAVSHIAQFQDEHGDVVCTYDLSPFAALGPVVAEMVLAFRAWGADKQRWSLQAGLAGVRRWFRFLQQRSVHAL